MNLKHLFNKHGSDKFIHGYGKFYETHLPSRVNSLLEIGVLRGHSMNAWREAYPEASLYGLDLFIENHTPTIESVAWLKGSQTDTDLLYHIRNDIKPQIIIEDASHDCIKHWVTLFSLISCCEQYYIEDLMTCTEEFYREGLAFEDTVLGMMLSGRFPFKFKLSEDQKIAVIWK